MNMKILLLYTPRSGSTSILSYFKRLKPEYECYNEPWFWWMISTEYGGVRNEYGDLIAKPNLFVKSAYKTFPVRIKRAVEDFDKVILLTRRNQKEQIESAVLAAMNTNYGDRTRRKYKTYTIPQQIYADTRDRYRYMNRRFKEIGEKYNLPIFYYEDLFYGDFNRLFEELGIEYHPIHFAEILDNSNRYRVGIEEIKKTKTLI